MNAPAAIKTGAGEPGAGAVTAASAHPELRPVPGPGANSARAVCFRDVVYRYGDTLALDHLDLTVDRSETVALLGPNGAGKSTTISLLLGLLRQQSGTVEVVGTTPHQAMAEGRLGAMLQQGTATGLPPGVKVATALRFVRRLYADPMPWDELVEGTGIGPLLNKRGQRLSGGQAQRVRFALALAGNPELMFLDEPTAAMDLVARRDFWRIVSELGAAGKTIVFATHHMEETDHADRVVVVNHGRVVADGPGASLKAAASTRRVRFVAKDVDRCVLDSLTGVTDVTVLGRSVSLASLDPDATIRDLCGRGVAFNDLEVTGARLEEAFIELTSGKARCAGPTDLSGPDLSGPAGCGGTPGAVA